METIRKLYEENFNCRSTINRVESFIDFAISKGHRELAALLTQLVVTDIEGVKDFGIIIDCFDYRLENRFKQTSQPENIRDELRESRRVIDFYASEIPFRSNSEKFRFLAFHPDAKKHDVLDVLGKGRKAREFLERWETKK